MATPTSIKIEKDIDLNSLFNLNYNFDLLKGIIEELLNNQKNLKEQVNNMEVKNIQKDQRITDLEREVRILKETKTEKTTTDAILVDLTEIKEHLHTHDDQIQDLYEKLKNFDGSGGDQSKVIELIKALERKTDSKFVIVEKNVDDTNDELAKLRKDLNNLNESHNNTMKQVAENKERIDILFGMLKDLRDLYDKLKKELADLRDFIDRKLQEMQAQIDLLMSFPSDGKGKVGEGDLKILSDILKRLSELEKNFSKYVTEARIEELWKLVLELKEKMKSKADGKDLEDLKEDFEDLKKELKKLKEKVKDISDETEKNSEDIRVIFKRLDEIMALINSLKNLINNLGANKGSGISEQIDLSKYVQLTIFESFKSDTEKSIKDIMDELDRLRRMIEDILAQLKNKVDAKDLKALEEYLLKKIEELAIACNKKFADKNETAKNFRYIEEQIRHILSLLMKKDEKGENWLLAKRPLMDFTCASCEAYIGELKDNRNQYIPWNKYPMRDPNDKLYRIGSGFSRMLQMINNDNPNQNNVPSQQQQQEFTREYKEYQGYQSGNEVNPKRSIQEIQREESKTLPKLFRKEKDNNMMIDGIDRDFKEEVNEGDENDNQPKVMKIFKKGKKKA